MVTEGGLMLRWRRKCPGLGDGQTAGTPWQKLGDRTMRQVGQQKKGEKHRGRSWNLYCRSPWVVAVCGEWRRTTPSGSGLALLFVMVGVTHRAKYSVASAVFVAPMAYFASNFATTIAQPALTIIWPASFAMRFLTLLLM